MAVLPAETHHYSSTLKKRTGHAPLNPQTVQAIAAAVVAIIAALGGLISQGGAATQNLSSNMGSSNQAVAPSNTGTNVGGTTPGTATNPSRPTITPQAFNDFDFKAIPNLDDTGAILIGFTEDGRKKLKKNGGLISFPDTINGKPIVEIQRGAFYDEDSLVTIYAWPAALERIGHRAFYDCDGLLRLPASWQNVTYIGKDAFESASRLESIPATWGNVTKLGRDAFHWTNIDELPSTRGIEII
ncbi:leucine-rich repeat protein [Corynebacterium choanae]|uniref:Leucine-rich repeat domain-containing protein n=1 Tax=Corynebacterium choanae TaxID=1862358 RepID=A0A3G6JDW7_9CORY|nr:leucine-rich repeat protein [Corynebacterium choanae]AZA14334.1 hypothetical protein CCHOA_09755 [Corynebacterium choanae]